MKNNQYKPNWEKIYIVQEQPVKQSNLSLMARSKVVKNQIYQSQNTESYGPCIPFNQDCECSLEELQRQEQILKNREIEERNQSQKTRSYLSIGGLFTNWMTDDNLKEEYDDLKQQVNNLTNENQELKNQQLTEFTLDINLEEESWVFSQNFEEIEKRVKSLKKLAILFSCNCKLYSRDHEQYWIGEWLSKKWLPRLQEFINQNKQLTHLNIDVLYHSKIAWPREIFFDFSKLTDLIFLSIPCPYFGEQLDLKKNENLEVLWLKNIIKFADSSESALNKLNLKNNKRLKHLVFGRNHFLDKINLHSLKLVENKELEYIDMEGVKINYLDLRENRKIIVQRKDNSSGFRQAGWWEIKCDEGIVHSDAHQVVRLAQ